MFDIETFKSELFESVGRLVEARQQYTAAVSSLVSLGDSRMNKSISSLPVSFEKLLGMRFKQSDMALTREYAGDHPVTIETPFIYYNFEVSEYSQPESYLSRRLYLSLLRLEEDFDSDVQKARLKDVIEEMPWTEIKQELDRQCDNTKNQGMRNAVNTVHKYFNFAARLNNPKPHRGGLMIEKHYNGDSWHLHGDVKDLDALIDAIRPIADVSGVSIGSALYDFRDALFENLQTRKPIPMRSRFGKGSPIDITVFKTKIKFVLTADLLEALQAAAMLYGEERHIEAVTAVVELCEAA